MSLILASPVHGELHEATWHRPAGNTDFRVTQAFGCTGFPAEPALGDCAHFHRGIDLGNGRCGADLLAVGRGTVKYAGKLTDGNLAVVLNLGDGWYAIYGHMGTVLTKTGAVVNPGQKIGAVGSTGASQCHLHFGLKNDVPPGTGINGVFKDTIGKWRDPWPHFGQNVTVHPKGAGINIRRDPGGLVIAVTKPDGRIHRVPDDADLGPTPQPRNWGGTVTGPVYTVDGKTSDQWERMALEGSFVAVASLLAVRSV